MSYRDWKSTGPDWDDEPDDDPCDHDDYETDIIMGEARCTSCGHRWIKTDEEIAAEIQRQVNYDDHVRRIEFRERWFWWWDDLKGHAQRLFLWRRRSPEIDDDIPF